MLQKNVMTDQHKEALAQGREDGRAVRRYLDALEAHRPRRGRPVDAKATRAQLDEITKTFNDQSLDPLSRLQLAQRRLDLQSRLDRLDVNKVDLGALENAFVKAAPAYSERKGLSYSAWRAAGVPPSVLKKAGIRR